MIITFLCGAFTLLLIHLDALAIVLVIVYVGVIMILFLFIIMMMNLKKFDFNHYRTNFYQYGRLGMFLFVILFIELHMMITYEVTTNGHITGVLPIFEFDCFYTDLYDYNMLNVHTESYTLLHTTGFKMYENFYLCVMLLALLLLITMISVIVLTVDHNKFFKKQGFFKQMQRGCQIVLVKKVKI
jgi:NADH-quinone oxidoreductase subunit J